MNFKVGDFVTRNSHNHDIVFVILSIEKEEAILKGHNVRLIANSPLSDLKICDEVDRYDDFDVELDYLKKDNILDREDDSFFYLPPKVLHLDGDADYLNKCLEFYKRNKIWAMGYTVREEELYQLVPKYLKEINPDILVITGHDAFLKKSGDKNDLHNYKNTYNFIRAVQEARKYEKSHEKLLIIAGACQSNYEELIKAGADFASSPKRVNIHALDPAIIATSISLTEKNKEIDLLDLLSKTRYGKDGMGGLIVNGLMYVGYPR